MKLISDTGKIVLGYHAKQVNIVASGNTDLEILIDGKILLDDISGKDVKSSMSTVLEPRLYNIIESQSGESHILTINVKQPDFKIFTFTFG